MSMPISKSPEQIMEEFDKDNGTGHHEPDFKKCDCEMSGGTTGDGYHNEILSRESERDHFRAYLRSSLASVIRWSAEQMPTESEYVFDEDDETCQEFEETLDATCETKGEAKAMGADEMRSCCIHSLLTLANKLEE